MKKAIASVSVESQETIIPISELKFVKMLAS